MNRPAYPCQSCNELYFVYRDLETHVRTIHKMIKIWKCKKCLQSFRGVDAFDRHIESDHGGTPLFSMGLMMSNLQRQLKEVF